MWSCASRNLYWSLKRWNIGLRFVASTCPSLQQSSEVSTPWRGGYGGAQDLAIGAKDDSSKQAKTVTGRYQSLVSSGHIQQDSLQLRATAEFDRLLKNIQSYEETVFIPNLKRNKAWFSSFRELFSTNKEKKSKPKGIYIYGGVGSGKTMLMDMFYQLAAGKYKCRLHFQDFMIDVHKRIHHFRVHNNGNQGDPVVPVATQISCEYWLLCLDEFQVTDVADALVLRRLGEELFSRGLILVTTSNRAPEELYWNGIQREHFLPFIPCLYDNCNVLHASSHVDYRMQMIINDLSKAKESKKQSTIFYVSDNEAERKAHIDSMFKRLSGCSTENSITLDVFSRKLFIKRTANGVARFKFSELCDEALSSADFVVLAETFRSVLIEDVPVIKLFSERNQARRFINLVDALYDHSTKLFCTSTIALEDLFDRENFEFSKDLEPEEFFAYERTLSRLHEMQTELYLSDMKWEVPTYLYLDGYRPEVAICTIQEAFTDSLAVSQEKDNTKHILRIFFWQTGQYVKLPFQQFSFVFKPGSSSYSSQPLLILKVENISCLQEYMLKDNTFSPNTQREPLIALKSFENSSFQDDEDRMLNLHKELLRCQAVDNGIPLRTIFALDELIRTEENYVMDLGIILDIFIVPYEDAIGSEILPMEVFPNALQSCFFQLRMLFHLHNEFLQKLYDFMLSGGLTRHFIGQIMIDQIFNCFQSVYLEYILQYDERIGEILYLRSQNEYLDSFLTLCEKCPRCKNLNLTSFLIKPVQRITKYNLLLKEMKKGYTTRNDQELYLEQAIEAIEEMLNLTETRNASRTRGSHSLRGLNFLENGNYVNLQVPGRSLLMEGWMTVKDSRRIDAKPCYFFLFTDILICSSIIRNRTLSKTFWKLTNKERSYKILWQEEIGSVLTIAVQNEDTDEADQLCWFRICFGPYNVKYFGTSKETYSCWLDAFNQASEFAKQKSSCILAETSKLNRVQLFDKPSYPGTVAISKARLE